MLHRTKKIFSKNFAFLKKYLQILEHAKISYFFCIVVKKIKKNSRNLRKISFNIFAFQRKKRFSCTVNN